MRIGICTSMNTEDPADLGLDQAEYCKKIGFDYIELSLDRIMMMDNSDFSKLGKQLESTGMPCLVCNNFIPPSVRLVGGDYKKEQFDEYIKESLHRAAAIGVHKVVFGSARARAVPSYLSIETAEKQLISCLNYIADEAQQYKIEIEVEHLNRYECNIINTFEQSVAIAKQLSRPNVKSILDYYHFALGGEDCELISRNEKWIGHIHFACTLGRHMPDIYDIQTLAPVLQKIRECIYDDTFSIEAYFPGKVMNDLTYAKVVSALRTALTKI